MKVKSKISAFLPATALVVVLLFSGQVLGQNQSAKAEEVKVNPLDMQRGPFARIPGLTEEQKTKIKDLKYERNKDQQMMKAQLTEKKAHLRTLTLADSPYRMAIDKTIDEISALNGTMMKHSVDMKFNMKSVFTPEQYKVWQQAKHMKSQGNRHQKMRSSGNKMHKQQKNQFNFNKNHPAETPDPSQNI